MPDLSEQLGDRVLKEDQYSMRSLISETITEEDNKESKN